MKYKVGDKVRVRKDLTAMKKYGRGKHRRIANEPMETKAGSLVTIKQVDNRYDTYLIEEDCWYWTEDMFEGLAEMGKIEIIVDGNKTIAKKDRKVGIAKCSPEDEFDIFVGAKLALERLEEQCKSCGWLKYGVGYYRPNIDIDIMYTYTTYLAEEADNRLKERGLIFKTKEGAVAAAKKMLAVLKEDEDND